MVRVRRSLEFDKSWSSVFDRSEDTDQPTNACLGELHQRPPELVRGVRSVTQPGKMSEVLIRQKTQEESENHVKKEWPGQVVCSAAGSPGYLQTFNSGWCHELSLIRNSERKSSLRSYVIHFSRGFSVKETNEWSNEPMSQRATSGRPKSTLEPPQVASLRPTIDRLALVLCTVWSTK